MGYKSAHDECVQDMARVLRVLVQAAPAKPEMAQARERVKKRKREVSK